MKTGQTLKVLAIGLFASTGLQAEPAAAQKQKPHCYWDGSGPFCKGKCPRGYTVVDVQSCLSGNKFLCCEGRRLYDRSTKKKSKR